MRSQQRVVKPLRMRRGPGGEAETALREGTVPWKPSQRCPKFLRAEKFLPLMPGNCNSVIDIAGGVEGCQSTVVPAPSFPAEFLRQVGLFLRRQVLRRAPSEEEVDVVLRGQGYSGCHSCFDAVVLSLNASAAFTTMKAGLVIRSCALSSR